MTKMVTTVSPHATLISKVYTHLSHFENDNIKSLILIYDEFMQIDTEPNPLAEKIGEEGDWFINKLLDGLETDTNSNYYFSVLKACTYQPELHKSFLRKEVMKKLSQNIINSDAHVALNSSDLLEIILVSDTHQDIISRFIGENYEAIMEVLRNLISKLYLNNRIDHEVVTTQLHGLNMLSELINRCGSVKDFSELYLQDTENLKMVMKKLSDENRDIKDAAFELLLCNIFTPTDMKSDEVNDTLYKNGDYLIEILEEDIEHIHDAIQVKRRKEAVEWLNKIKLNL